MNQPLSESLLQSLQQILGDRFSLDEEILKEHGKDESSHSPIPPQAVCFPESEKEVVEVVKVCAAHRTPMIPFGKGTSVEGQVLADRGGVSIDLARMNRVLAWTKRSNILKFMKNTSILSRCIFLIFTFSFLIHANDKEYEGVIDPIKLKSMRESIVYAETFDRESAVKYGTVVEGFRGQGIHIKNRKSSIHIPSAETINPAEGTISWWVYYNEEMLESTKLLQFPATLYINYFGKNTYDSRHVHKIGHHWHISKGAKFVRYPKGGLPPHSQNQKKRWVHLAYVWQGNSTNFLVDGYSCSPLTLNDAFSKFQFKEVLIGGGDCIIDEIRFYNRALTSADIKGYISACQSPALQEMALGVLNKLAKVGTGTMKAEYRLSDHSLQIYADLAAKNPKSVKARLTIKNDKNVTIQTKIILIKQPQRFFHTSVPLLKELKEGSYTISLSYRDKVLKSNFTRKHWEWEGNKIGFSSEVSAPWTPITQNKNLLSVWGRDYRFANSGFPSSIKVLQREPTRGKKVVDILASPVRVNLRSRGKELKVISFKSVKINLLDQTHGEVLGESVVDEGLKISVRGKLEFDGFYRMQVTITPPARGVMIDSLDISVALTNEQAILFNAGSDQMRSQKTFLDIEKKSDGVLWDSINAITVGKEQKLTAVKRNNPIWPHVWVGNDDRGIAMMVENTRSWLIDRNKPVMDLVRKEGVTTLRLILVNKPVLMNKSITADFSLQATPVRSRPAGGSWKKEEWYGWGYFDNAVIAHDIEPGSVTKKTAEANPWYRTEEARQQNRWWKYGCMQTHRISQNDPVYGEMIRLTADEWSVGLYTPSHIDFLLWAYKKWHDKESMDGVYFDNTFPQSSSSLGSGLGWIDEKGKRQSSYNVFLQREFMKRLHHYLQSVGALPVLKIHSTDCAAVGYMGFGDFWMDGENGGYTPHGEQVEHDKGNRVIDFVDRWYNPTGMTNLRIMLGKQWGVIHHYLYSWGFESTYAILGMFDLEKNYRAMSKKPFHEFGRFEKDIEFIPYWSNKKVGKWLENGEDIFVTAWKRAGKVRLLISNLSSEDRAVSFKVDLQALGLSNTAIVMDEREGSELDFTDSTLKRINIARHDYTTLIIAEKGLYTPLPQNFGYKLSPPAKLWINEYCDNFSQLKSNWAKNASPNITKATVDHGVESPAFSIMSGYLRIRTSTYIYSNLKQKFNQDNCSVQIKVRDYVGKYAIGYGPGLHLSWGNGASVHLTVGPGVALKSKVHHFHTWSMVNGKKVFEKYGDLIAKVNWLKIELNNEKICFYTSNDAKEWSPLSRHKRDAFIGAAQVLAIGHGEDKDVYLEGYSFDSFFKDLIVAKLK